MKSLKWLDKVQVDYGYSYRHIEIEIIRVKPMQSGKNTEARFPTGSTCVVGKIVTIENIQLGLKWNGSLEDFLARSPNVLQGHKPLDIVNDRSSKISLADWHVPMEAIVRRLGKICKDDRIENAILLAARNDRSAMIKLARDPEDLIRKNHDLSKALFRLSCWIGLTEAVEIVFREQGSVDDKGLYAMTGAMWASARGHLETLQLLVEIGADVNRQNSFTWSMSDLANNNGHSLVKEWLLKNGAPKVGDAYRVMVNKYSTVQK